MQQIFLAYPSYGSSNEGYVDKLTAEKEIFEKALSKAKNGSIYTELTRERKKSFLNKLFFENEYDAIKPNKIMIMAVAPV